MCGIAGLVLKCEFEFASISCLTSVTTLLLLGLRLGALKQSEKSHTAEMIKVG
jgi:hypothetical protein